MTLVLLIVHIFVFSSWPTPFEAPEDDPWLTFNFSAQSPKHFTSVKCFGLEKTKTNNNKPKQSKASQLATLMQDEVAARRPWACHVKQDEVAADARGPAMLCRTRWWLAPERTCESNDGRVKMDKGLETKIKMPLSA